MKKKYIFASVMILILLGSFCITANTSRASSSEITKNLIIISSVENTDFEYDGFVVNTFGGVSSSECEQVKFCELSSSWDYGSPNETIVNIPNISSNFACLSQYNFNVHELKITIDKNNLEEWAGLQFVLYNEDNFKDLQTVNGDENFFKALTSDNDTLVCFAYFTDDLDENSDDGYLYLIDNTNLSIYDEDIYRIQENYMFDSFETEKGDELSKLLSDVINGNTVDIVSDIIIEENEVPLTNPDTKTMSVQNNHDNVDESPLTLDNAHIFVLIGLMLVSVTTIIIVKFKKNIFLDK